MIPLKSIAELIWPIMSLYIVGVWLIIGLERELDATKTSSKQAMHRISPLASCSSLIQSCDREFWSVNPLEMAPVHISHPIQSLCTIAWKKHPQRISRSLCRRGTLRSYLQQFCCLTRLSMTL